MAFKTHKIVKYGYSITVSNNDFAAKMQLMKQGLQPNTLVEVGQVKFIYEGNPIPPAELNADLEFAVIYLPEKKLPLLVDLLRNEKPVILTINPPFAFLGTEFEMVGDNDKN
jgi:hypothetical protein